MEAKFMQPIGFLLILAGAVVALYGNSSGGLVSIGAGVIFIVLSSVNTSDLEEINIFQGVIIKLRKTLNEADRILNNLKEVSKPLSETAITSASLHMKENKGINREQLYELVVQLENVMLSLKVGEEEIENAKQYYYLVTNHELAEDVKRSLQENHREITKCYYPEYQRKLSQASTIEEHQKIHDEQAFFSETKSIVLCMEYLDNNYKSTSIKNEIEQILKFYDGKLLKDIRDEIYQATIPMLDELEVFNREKKLLNPSRYHTSHKRDPF